MKANVQDGVVGTDGNTGALVPPGGLLPARAKPITVEDAERSAKRAGMMTVKVSRIKGCKELGDYLSQIGVLSYGRALLAFTAEHARKTLEECDKIRRKITDPNAQAALLSTKESVQGQLIKAAHELIESVKVNSTLWNGEVSNGKSFIPGRPAFPQTAVQLNVNVGGSTPPTDEKQTAPSA